MSRFAARVLMVSGALLLVDAGTTLAWQEPISALLTARAQSGLEQQLESAPAPAPGRRLTPDRVEALSGAPAPARPSDESSFPRWAATTR